MKPFFKIIFLLLIVSLPVCAQEPSVMVPEFNFFRLDKTVFSKKDLAKGSVLFFVFFDTECEHCQHAIATINQRYKELKKTALYLITMDNQQKLTLFLNTYGKNLLDKPNITLLQDLNNVFITRFKPKKYPSLFLYSAKNKLLLYDDDEKKLPDFFNKIKETK
jgi:cytochrome oxidase Cu insertion factor (SCO1/SenC/PrrC family)